MRIYLTHCSAKKDPTLKGTAEQVTPDKLYTATPTKRFMEKCKEKHVKWAIFSDKYGVWFPSEKHEWYDKNPNKVKDPEYEQLVKDFKQKLSGFSEVWFYHNPGRFHKLYRKLIEEPSIKVKTVTFNHLTEIE